MAVARVPGTRCRRTARVRVRLCTQDATYSREVPPTWRVGLSSPRTVATSARFAPRHSLSNHETGLDVRPLARGSCPHPQPMNVATCLFYRKTEPEQMSVGWGHQ